MAAQRGPTGKFEQDRVVFCAVGVIVKLTNVSVSFSVSVAVSVDATLFSVPKDAGS